MSLQSRADPKCVYLPGTSESPSPSSTSKVLADSLPIPESFRSPLRCPPEEQPISETASSQLKWLNEWSAGLADGLPSFSQLEFVPTEVTEDNYTSLLNSTTLLDDFDQLLAADPLLSTVGESPYGTKEPKMPAKSQTHIKTEPTGSSMTPLGPNAAFASFGNEWSQFGLPPQSQVLPDDISMFLNISDPDSCLSEPKCGDDTDNLWPNLAAGNAEMGLDMLAGQKIYGR